MRRYQIVLGATALGLAGVLSYHTVSGGNGVVLGTPAGSGSVSSGSPSGSSTSPAGSSSTSTSTRAASEVHRADGTEEEYRYGILELQVTVTGRRITTVEPVVEEATDPRSAQINGQALPLLRQEALEVQSADIDGVSGASYTSAAYQASLQSALDKLGR